MELPMICGKTYLSSYTNYNFEILKTKSNILLALLISLKHSFHKEENYNKGSHIKISIVVNHYFLGGCPNLIRSLGFQS